MLGDGSEFADCVRSITMLQNLQGSITSAPGPLGSTMAPLAQGYGWLSSCIDDRVLSSQSQMDSGVMKYVVELSEAWRMARAYAARRIGADALPPWNQQSDYSSVMHLHLEFDCCVPLRYRFAANRFADQDQDSLERHRDYWVPWLFVQIVYAVIPCILNHPFLLSIRLKNFRNTIPQSFIHQSFEYINRHAGWVVYFINLLEKKSFYISDPALAHCVVIVATIHLQHSFVNDRALRDKAQQAFDKCMKFLRGMGGTWPSVTIMVRNRDSLSSANVRQTTLLSCGKVSSPCLHQTHMAGTPFLLTPNSFGICSSTNAQAAPTLASTNPYSGRRSRSAAKRTRTCAPWPNLTLSDPPVFPDTRPCRRRRRLTHLTKTCLRRWTGTTKSACLRVLAG